MVTSVNLKHNLTTFIRADQFFIDNILPHANHSIHAGKHYLYMVFTPSVLAKNSEVAAWIDAQEPTSHHEAFISIDGSLDLSDEPHRPNQKAATVVGISLSQLNYHQLMAFEELNVHAVIKLPAMRDSSLYETKNPLLYTKETDKFLYFIRNRELEKVDA